jgi:hypothetical protein
MRGTHATLATEAGMSGRAVAQALGHTSPTTTYRSYATPEAVAARQQRRVADVIELTEWGTEGPADRSPAFPNPTVANENESDVVELWGIEPQASRVRFPRGTLRNQ